MKIRNKKIFILIKEKKGKHFIERNGDWICSSCKNLNFAFRIICNRCHLLKDDSEKNRNKKTIIRMKINVNIRTLKKKIII